MVRCHQPLSLPVDGCFVEHSPLRWIARDSSKPSRGGTETWLLHAGHSWSEAHLEDDAATVTAALLHAFAQLGGPDPASVQATAHRWRYADTANPLNAGAWWDAAAGLGMCGDWLHSGSVEGAWLSGRSLARHVHTALHAHAAETEGGMPCTANRICLKSHAFAAGAHLPGAKSGLRCGTRSNTAPNAADGSASSHLRLGNRHEHGAALVTQRPAPARPTRASRRVQDGGAVHAAGAVPAGHSSQNPLGLCPHRPHRRAWLAKTIQNLAQSFHELRSQLLILNAPAAMALPALAQALGAGTIVCEDIAAPEEQAEVRALRAAGLQVHTVWHSSLLHPDQLPWPVRQLPACSHRFARLLSTPSYNLPASASTGGSAQSSAEYTQQVPSRAGTCSGCIDRCL
jgi:hypothetical protein